MGIWRWIRDVIAEQGDQEEVPIHLERGEDGGYDFRTELIESSTRAGYYPGAAPIHVKIITERGSGLLLGAQIVGGPGSGPGPRWCWSVTSSTSWWPRPPPTRCSTRRC